MERHLLSFLALASICNLLHRALPTHSWPDAFRRSIAEQNGLAEWTREAQRNLSRWESRLLLNTLGKLYSSHVLGQVPFDLFGPVVTCPPPSKLMRLDPTGPTEHPAQWLDGAKWMCVPFPQTARPGCVVLSFGSNDQFEFEQAALDMTPCTVYTFDCTAGMLGNATHFSSIDPARHVFQPYCVGSKAMAAKNPSQVLTWEGILQVARSTSTTGPGRVLQTHGSSGDSAHGRAEGSALLHGGNQQSDANVPYDGLEAVVHDRRRLQRSGIWSASSGISGGGGNGGGGRVRRRDTGPEVFILKIDVEGFEWQLLSEWTPHTPGLPTFLAVEIHNWVEDFVLGPPPMPPRPRYSALAWWLYGKRVTQAAERKAAAAVVARRQRVYGGELSLMFLHLARLGYAIASRENNPNGDHEAKLCCAEFLFIRVRGPVPEESRPGTWEWPRWFSSVKEGLAPLVRGAARRRLLLLQGR